MQQDNKISDFCNIVCNQIRWKKTHKTVFGEIENHLIEQRDEYINSGYTEADATDKAINDFGDATYIGTELDRIHRPKNQLVCFIILGILSFVGILIQSIIILSGSISANIAPQIVSYILGIAILTVTYFIDFTILSKYSFHFYVTVFFLSVILCIFPFYISFKYYIALLYPLALSCSIYHFRTRGYFGIAINTLFTLTLLVFCHFTNNILGIILCLFIALIITPVSIYRKWFNIKRSIGLLLCLSPFILMIIVIFTIPSTREGILSILGYVSTNYELGAGYIPNLLQEMTLNAKMIGQANTLSSPFPDIFHTDYILAFILYRYGWLAFGFMVALFYALIIICLNAAIKQKSVLGQLFTLSITGVFTVQITLYILSNLGIVNSTLSVLPFVSYGSFANLINFAMLGILLSVFRNEEIMVDRVTKPLITRQKIDEIISKLSFEGMDEE